MKNFKDEYYKILSDNIPDFLKSYVNTKEMQKQDGISVTCGTIYSKLFDEIWYSSLDHSIAVALVIWHFTKDKKQTLAGLFHDIATPTFKHAIDFMNGDYKTQESTEEKTNIILKNSKEITNLLYKDNILLNEVKDYKIYPIADNDTPRLSADRLEYTLSNGLGATRRLFNINDAMKMYNDIEIQINEDGIVELGFIHPDIAIQFVHYMSILSREYRSPKNKYTMEFLAQTVKKLVEREIIDINDLYKLSENKLMDLILESDSDISDNFKIWLNLTDIYESDELIPDRFCVDVNPKARYINPLVRYHGSYKRIADISKEAFKDIEEAKNYKTKKYIYSKIKKID